MATEKVERWSVGYSLRVVELTEGGAYTIPPLAGRVIFVGSDVNAYTLVLPATPFDGEVRIVSFDAAVDTLTVTAAATIGQVPTNAAPGNRFSWVYVKTHGWLGSSIPYASAGAGPLVAAASVTVPANRLEHSEVVTFTGCTGAKKIMVNLAPHLDTDENDPEMLDVASLTASPGTDQATVSMTFRDRTSGPIKLTLMAV